MFKHSKQNKYKRISATIIVLDMEDIKEQREQMLSSRRLSASILARMETYELKQAIKRVITKTSNEGVGYDEDNRRI